MALVDWTRLILLSLVWGGTFVLVEVALPFAGPATIVLARVGLAAITLVAYCRATGKSARLTPAIIGTFALMGLFNNALPFSLIAWGQTEISASYASILNATTPLFTVAVAHAWPAGERATGLKVAGVVAGGCGVAVMIGIDAIAGAASGVWGQIAVLGASLSYGVAMVLGRRLAHLAPTYAAAGMLCASTLIMLPAALWLEAPFQQMPFPVIAALVTLALVCTAFAYILYFKILASAGPTNLSLVTFLIPASAIAYGVALLGETVQAHHLGGLALILVGLALVDGRAVQTLWRRVRAS
ncbi:MAG: DMT family transporter [Alphaproteobacteria bacterium]